MFDAGKLRSVGSLNAAGQSLRAAEVSQVVVCSWMIIARSWGRSSHWLQLVDHRGKPRLVKSLNAAGRSLWAAEVGRVVLVASRYSELSWLVVAMLGQSITASHYVDWMLSCWSIVVGRSISRVWQYVGLTGGVSIWLLARNNESLRGPDDTMLV